MLSAESAAARVVAKTASATGRKDKCWLAAAASLEGLGGVPQYALVQHALTLLSAMLTAQLPQPSAVLPTGHLDAMAILSCAWSIGARVAEAQKSMRAEMEREVRRRLHL